MLNDQAVRERILTELDTSFLVEAGAGSGKTTSLVGRMLAYIESGKAKVGQLAAITFTRKAADELRGRFRFELEKRIRTAKEPQSGRLEAAIQEIDQCYIGTIHAFCVRLLRERPIEAGIDPMFRELEEEEALVLQDQCWDEYLLQVRSREDALFITEPEERRIPMEDLKEVYRKVSGYRDVQVQTTPSPRPDFDVIRLSLPDLIGAAFPYIPTVQPEKDWDGLQKMIKDGKRLIVLHGLKEDQRVLQLALLFERNIKVVQNRWTDKSMGKAFQERFQDWQTQVLFPFLSAWREHLYPKLIEQVLPAVRYCEQRRNQLGVMDFQDLLLRAARLLREYRHVREYFGRKYTRLFVDEFQDTDPIQAEIMFRLTGSEPDETDWRKMTPKPGSLFVVGDPKQSIYRFRRADISIYNFVKNKLAGCGKCVQLRANFRSVHVIGEFVNTEFQRRFPGRETVHQAAYAAMETQLANPPGAAIQMPVANPAGAAMKMQVMGHSASVAVEAQVGNPEGSPVNHLPESLHGTAVMTYEKMPGGKAAIAEADAKRIARYIAWACAGNLHIQERAAEGYRYRPAVPGDFLILLKHKEFLPLYADYLELFGVPAVTTGGAPGYDEIGTLALLARSLSDPDDKIALLAVLRGMFGVSDHAMYHYKMEGFPFSYLFLPDCEQVSATSLTVFKALERLAGYYGQVATLPAWAALMSIVEDLGLLPLAVVRQGGMGRAGTLLQLLQKIQTEERAAAGWMELTALLLQQAEEGRLEGNHLLAGQQDAVRLMNLHKAKGLEAPVVFLACPCGDSDHDATEHVDRSGPEPLGYFVISRRRGYQTEIIAQPPGWQELAERERAFMIAEQERLLYVAATRAKQLLVISRYPDKPAIDPWSGFAESLREAPELEDIEWEPVLPGEFLGVDNEGVAEFRGGRLREKLTAPTYRTASVTELAKQAGTQPPRPQKGRGLAFGSTVHRSIELLGTRRTIDELEDDIAVIAAEEGLDSGMVPEVKNMLAVVEESQVWKRALAAKTMLQELPFRTMMDGQAYADLVFDDGGDGDHDRDGDIWVNGDHGDDDYDDNAGDEGGVGRNGEAHELLLKGVVDLLFEEEDGWVIVDFKTDIYEDGQQGLFVDFYRPQVQAYATELQRSFGLKVKEQGLYFLHGNEYVVL
ncbi:UvrD-helicase domain-containing protein [Paenibacillus macerans]|uniref:UvrD-helicase domain-containing protein n=1 Tax=Paenibacillus macerans TaxID=44252 RepID=UPI001F1175C5|nr:UvrD-helicase domain-containing protein [Paenibacillus macerans]UMV47339.1 UvrD-helicase domain-containing protein [Paenibacillus macerans]